VKFISRVYIVKGEKAYLAKTTQTQLENQSKNKES